METRIITQVLSIVALISICIEIAIMIHLIRFNVNADRKRLYIGVILSDIYLVVIFIIVSLGIGFSITVVRSGIALIVGFVIQQSISLAWTIKDFIDARYKTKTECEDSEGYK